MLSVVPDYNTNILHRQTLYRLSHQAISHGLLAVDLKQAMIHVMSSTYSVTGEFSFHPKHWGQQ